ncbi:MAG TPA: ferritin family protein [Dehalococcoidales bacterium]|nr:ferritin family protein [Dehalococcoidales bacterium]
MTNERSLTLAALNSSIQMEIDGRNYYLEMHKACRQEEGRKLFQTLAAEEDIHRQNFEKIFRIITAQKKWPEEKPEIPESRRSTLFSEAAKNADVTESELEAIRKAMEMENKTRDFYLERAEKATFQAEKQFYTILAREERTHHNLLQDYYEFMQDAAQYYSVKEKHSLDGG